MLSNNNAPCKRGAIVSQGGKQTDNVYSTLSIIGNERAVKRELKVSEWRFI
jgi:hypothetical protein